MTCHKNENAKSGFYAPNVNIIDYDTNDQAQAKSRLPVNKKVGLSRYNYTDSRLMTRKEAKEYIIHYYHQFIFQHSPDARRYSLDYNVYE